MEKLSFLFTEAGFLPDITGESPDNLKKEAKAWTGEQAISTLYEFGAGPKPEGMTASASYLYLVASSFFRALTDLPGLEVAREKAKVKISADQMELLLESVPFGLGSEHITEDWIKNIYRQFQKQYRSEMKAYPGTVEMYLAEKNQVVLITTEFDTFTVARLIHQAMPIRQFMQKDDLISFELDDYVDEVREVMKSVTIAR